MLFSLYVCARMCGQERDGWKGIKKMKDMTSMASKRLNVQEENIFSSLAVFLTFSSEHPGDDMIAYLLYTVEFEKRKIYKLGKASIHTAHKSRQTLYKMDGCDRREFSPMHHGMHDTYRICLMSHRHFDYTQHV